MEMKKMLVGLFILGSVAFGCESNEKAIANLNQSYEKIVMEIEKDVKIHNEFGIMLGINAKKVDKELSNFSKHLTHLKEHKLSKEQEKGVFEKVAILDFIIETYCRLAKENK